MTTERKLTAKPEATCSTWPTWRITDQPRRYASGQGGVLVSASRDRAGVLHVHVWDAESGADVRIGGAP